ncbi:MAG: HAD-IA family hydrolase [archaeon]|nr:HAD-IA family hydrolase [archaeon]
MFKAIVFDLDDTLIDFFNLKVNSLNAAVKAMIKAGLPLEEKQSMLALFDLHKEHGIEDKEILNKFLEKHHKLDFRILCHGINAYRITQKKYFKPYDGVIPTLKKLKKRKNLKLAILSDAPNFKLWLRLVESGLDGFFDVVVGLDDSGQKKPSIIPFKLVMQKLELKPEEILYVGDWPERDIAGAKKVGFKTCLSTYRIIHPMDDVRKGKLSPELEPDFKIKKFEEILKIIK